VEIGDEPFLISAQLGAQLSDQLIDVATGGQALGGNTHHQQIDLPGRRIGDLHGQVAAGIDGAMTGHGHEARLNDAAQLDCRDHGKASVECSKNGSRCSGSAASFHGGILAAKGEFTTY
jgi:hypothetical protein